MAVRTLHLEQKIHTNTPFETSIVSRVRELYEIHPYPRYPLMARPHWSSGYTSSLIWTHYQYPGQVLGTPSSKSLIAGSGEMLPWVMERWAPQSFLICVLDLSLRSLRRAFWRRWLTRPFFSLGHQVNLLFNTGKISPWLNTKDLMSPILTKNSGPSGFHRPGSYYCHQDLEHFLAQTPDQTWNQIDAFGVLHHLASPRQALFDLFRTLAPGGVLRLMVYNAPARRWISNIQRLFRLLELDYHRESDYHEAHEILKKAASHNPKLHKRLNQMGISTLSNRARFADTFFHPRETKTHPILWRQWLKSAGFEVLGQFDRYGELDHLPNPLWAPPSPQTLQKEIDRGIFCGNLEFYVTKPRSNLKKPPAQELSPRPLTLTPFMLTQLLMQGPPVHWFQFPETQSLGPLKRKIIWLSFLKNLASDLPFSRILPDTSSVLKSGISLAALQRLARLGCFSRAHLQGDWEQKLLAPLEAPPEEQDPSSEFSGPIPSDFRKIIDLRLQNLPVPRRHPHFQKALEKRLLILLQT